MALYKYIQKIWKKPKQELDEIWKDRLYKWRRESSIRRIAKPTRIDRARSLGYKAKQGVVMARARIERGGRDRAHTLAGRRPKRSGLSKFFVKKSLQLLCEERVSKKYPNLEVLNSYYVAEDGKYKWYEVIMLDKNHNSIKNDKELGWVKESKHTGRAHRGKTSAGRKSRGLVRTKGRGAEKVRPSLNAHKNQGN
jgi:large subunit ribosomal protein L15e